MLLDSILPPKKFCIFFGRVNFTTKQGSDCYRSHHTFFNFTGSCDGSGGGRPTWMYFLFTYPGWLEPSTNCWRGWWNLASKNNKNTEYPSKTALNKKHGDKKKTGKKLGSKQPPNKSMWTGFLKGESPVHEVVFTRPTSDSGGSSGPSQTRLLVKQFLVLSSLQVYLGITGQSSNKFSIAHGLM